MAGGAAGIFGRGSAAQQLFEWQVLGQALSAALGPEFELLTREVNKLLPATPLSPAQLADMVVRNIVQHAAASEYAKESGIAPADFERMVQSAGEPPSPQEMLAAVRRGVVPARGTGPDSVSLQQAVAESRVYNKYLPVLEALSNLPLSPADAVDAVVEGQIEHERGAHEAFLNGVDAERFQILVNTRGRPPSPTELNELHRRGLIGLEGTGPDATTVQQGIFEGATKDKWWRFFAALSEYVPPPRTVVAMVKDGVLSDERGIALLKQSGLNDQTASEFIAGAHHQKLQAQRDLTFAQIGALYKDRLISATEAGQMLSLLHYTTEEIAFVIDLWDFEALQAKVRSAVSKIHSLYVAHHIDAATASAALDGLQVPAAGRDELLQVWNLERDANVQRLTAGEIADAVYYGLLPIEDGVAKLRELGWQQDDAVIRIGIRLHGKPPPAATTHP